MALAPWNVLASGKLRTDAEEERRRQTGEKGRTVSDPNWERTPAQREMSLALEKVAKEVGTEHITAVAIAYLMQKTPYVFPIVGGRKVEHLEANLDALRITLTPEHVKYLESIIPFHPGFPHNFIVSRF
jgi:aryl-alcohol dehydrogenase-like predicted oxidoreductase